VERDLMIAYGNEAELLRIMSGAGTVEAALSTNRRMLPSRAAGCRRPAGQSREIRLRHEPHARRWSDPFRRARPGDPAVPALSGILEALMKEDAGNLRVRVHIVSIYDHIGQRLEAGETGWRRSKATASRWRWAKS